MSVCLRQFRCKNIVSLKILIEAQSVKKLLILETSREKYLMRNFRNFPTPLKVPGRDLTKWSFYEYFIFSHYFLWNWMGLNGLFRFFPSSLYLFSRRLFPHVILFFPVCFPGKSFDFPRKNVWVWRKMGCIGTVEFSTECGSGSSDAGFLIPGSASNFGGGVYCPLELIYFDPVRHYWLKTCDRIISDSQRISDPLPRG